MKRNIFNLSLCALALSGLLLVSCDKEEKIVEVLATVPTISATASVSVDYEGGTYSFNYSVANPTSDGAVSCAADVSWITGFVESSGAFSFTAAENTGEDLRTGNITVTYTYTENGAVKYAFKKVAVIQSGTSDPALSVQPTAITAGYGAGAYTFGYTITNPADDGDISCTSDASWLGNFDYSTYGNIGFTVTENETFELRTATITVTYTYQRIVIEKQVTVVQNHPKTGYKGDLLQMIGTYTATASRYYKGTYEEAEWTMVFYENPDDGSRLWIAGFTPYYEGAYGTNNGQYYGTTYSAYCYLDGDELVVPSQIFAGTLSTLFGSYNCGILSCHGLDAETHNGYYSVAPITFKYNNNSDLWTSDHGAYAAVLTTDNLEYIEDGTVNMYDYLDCLYKTISLKKISEETSSVNALPGAAPASLWYKGFDGDSVNNEKFEKYE